MSDYIHQDAESPQEKNLTLLDQALAIAAEGYKVFPVMVRSKPGGGHSKQPLPSKVDLIREGVSEKGAEHCASSDPEVITKLFDMAGDAANEIGVALRRSNIILFDIDTYKDPSKLAIASWRDRYIGFALDYGLVHQTASGGSHFIFKMQTDARQFNVAREIEVKLQWTVWPRKGGLYKAVHSRPKDKLGLCNPDMLELIEESYAGGSAMMSLEDAKDALRSNSERHDSMRRITYDWVSRSKGERDLEDLAIDLEMWVREEFAHTISPDRMATLLEFDPLPEYTADGKWTALGGEMGRLLTGAYDHWRKHNPDVERIWSKLTAKLAGRSSAPGIAEVVETDTIKKDADDFVTVYPENDLRKAGYITPDWLIKDRLIRAKIYGYTGPSNVGKTTYLSYLMACLTSGRGSMWGIPDFEPKKVLFIANEEEAYEITNKILAALTWNKVPAEDRNYFVRGNDTDEGIQFSLTQPGKDGKAVVHERNLETVIRVVEKYDIDVVYFDPLNSLLEAGDGDDMSVKAGFEFFRRLSQTTRCVTAFTHHPPKMADKEFDHLRGELSAFRGHGSIASQLTGGGQTVWPVVPYFDPPVGNDGKQKPNTQVHQDRQRKVLMQLQAEGLAPKFVRIDDVKVRGAYAGPRCYEMVAHPDEPVAYVPHDLSGAEARLQAAVTGIKDDAMDKVQARTEPYLPIAEAIYRLYPEGGIVKNTELHKKLVEKGIENYSTNERLRPERPYWQDILTKIKLIPTPSGHLITVKKKGENGVEITVDGG